MKKANVENDHCTAWPQTAEKTSKPASDQGGNNSLVASSKTVQEDLDFSVSYCSQGICGERDGRSQEMS